MKFILFLIQFRPTHETTLPGNWSVFFKTPFPTQAEHWWLILIYLATSVQLCRCYRLWVMKWKINRKYVKGSTHIIVLYFSAIAQKKLQNKVPEVFTHITCLVTLFCVLAFKGMFSLNAGVNIYSVTHLFSVVHWWTYQDAKRMRGALIAIKAATRHNNITVQCQTNGEYSDVEKNNFLLPFYLATSNCGV